MEQHPEPLRRLYGIVLDHFWRLRGTTASSLAAGAQCDSSYLYLIRDGKRLPNPKINERLDTLLDTGGLLVTLGQVVEEETRRAGRIRRSVGTLEPEDSVRRRVLIQQCLAAIATGTTGAVAALETVRNGLMASLVGDEPADLDVDEWAEVAWDYGRSYLTTAPEVLVADLAADVVDVQQRFDQEHDDARRAELSRTSACLAGIMAMSLINLGHLRAAHRWWRTARQAADASRDMVVRTWVRQEEAIRALYTHRSPQTAIEIADEVLAIGGQSYAAPAIAAKAQAFALLGRADEARRAIRAVESALTKTSLVDDDRTIYGWPENCLRHVESYVYAHIGDTAAAHQAQQAALMLYPPTERRSRAQVQLHQALCLVHDGHIDDGARFAQELIASLPTSQRTTLVLEIGQHVLRSVPSGERDRSSVTGLYDVLAQPAGQGRA